MKRWAPSSSGGVLSLRGVISPSSNLHRSSKEQCGSTFANDTTRSDGCGNTLFGPERFMTRVISKESTPNWPISQGVLKLVSSHAGMQFEALMMLTGATVRSSRRNFSQRYGQDTRRPGRTY
ncbi:hypothetical protein CGCSCA1_v006693 [Colletotrichum siamense]|nr:hypothetical protein CGCSCA1_v006693 [Colletotrichum siamense]